MGLQKLSLDKFNDFMLSADQLKNLKGGEDDLCKRTLASHTTYNCQTSPGHHGSCDASVDTHYHNDPCSDIAELQP